VQPLQSHRAHPTRRPRALAGEKVERRADAETDADCIATLGDGVGDHLLLRRADANESEARTLLGGKGGSFDDGLCIAPQAHRRAVPAHVRQSIAALQLSNTLRIAADNDDRLMALDHRVEQPFGEIGAGGERQLQPGARREAAQNAAVVQQQPGALVKRATRRIVRQADDVIDVRRRQIGKRAAERGAHRHCVHRRVEIEPGE